ncbi:MAG: FkbM family methyltransferase [Sphingobacteriaceae bacterium]|nr:FkbM family methyltransferase [Sphingobacteriaceae bacterium]
MELKNAMPSEINKVKWYADKVENKLRYTYPLNENSLVLDVGGYEGEFAAQIFSRYQTKIIVFEPVSFYYNYLETIFHLNKNIQIIPKGLGAKNEELTISVMEEASSYNRKASQHKKGKDEKIRIIDVKDFIKENNLQQIDLIKINIEGAEYDLLDRMIEINFIKKCNNLQIQFHDFYPGYESRYKKIHNELSKTHHLTYQYPFVWENWELNKS